MTTVFTVIAVIVALLAVAVFGYFWLQGGSE
jgi:hypothetical protein